MGPERADGTGGLLVVGLDVTLAGVALSAAVTAEASVAGSCFAMIAEVDGFVVGASAETALTTGAVVMADECVDTEVLEIVAGVFEIVFRTTATGVTSGDGGGSGT